MIHLYELFYSFNEVSNNAGSDQAAFALPGIQKSQQNFNDVFEAMTLQRDRLKDLQQLADWR